MGIIGTGIFDDDLASDVRGEYRDLIVEGKTGPEATDILLRRKPDVTASPREAPVFWLALAATQWESGRLEDRVRESALAVLNGGTDLVQWESDPKLLRRRRRVLERLRTRLLSTQPPEKNVRKRYRDTCDWDVGEIIGYRLRAGSMVLLRVVDHVTDALGTSPLCELLDWIGTEPPQEDRLKELKVRSQDWPPDGSTDQFTVFRRRADDLPVNRIVRLGVKTKPNPARAVQAVFSWRELDRSLAHRYASLLRGAV